MKGDFRGFMSAKPATLQKMCNDWNANQVTAGDKWKQSMVEIPGVVMDVKKYNNIGGPDMFAVTFRDYKANKHIGIAYTRDDLATNKDKIEPLRKGQLIKVVGVVNLEATDLTNGRCAIILDKFRYTFLKVNKKKKN